MAVNRAAWVPGVMAKKPPALKKSPAPKPGSTAPTGGLVSQAGQMLIDYKDVIDRFVDKVLFE